MWNFDVVSVRFMACFSLFTFSIVMDCLVVRGGIRLPCYILLRVQVLTLRRVSRI